VLRGTPSRLGRALDVSVLDLERALDMEPFHLGQRHERAIGSLGRWCLQREMLTREGRAVGAEDGALDRVPELAHVARP
jgi:hypothetical protein